MAAPSPRWSVRLSRASIALLVVSGLALAGCGGGAPSGVAADGGNATADALTADADGAGSGPPAPASPPDPEPPPPEPPPPPASAPNGPFPIVLAHGFSGWSTIASISYFYGVPDALRARGETILVTQVDPYQSVAIRAQQLADQIRQFVVEQQVARVNIVAHSQGGLDARYAISSLGLGEVVASLTTVAAPHQGTYVADVIKDDVPGLGQQAVAALVDLLGEAASGRKQDMLAAMADLATSSMAQFNDVNRDDPRVTYYSYAGQSCVICDHPVNALLLPTYTLLKSHDGANDGLVPVESARWGTYLGAIPTDHFGEIGQPAGLTNFDDVSFYLRVVDGLRAAGF